MHLCHVNLKSAISINQKCFQAKEPNIMGLVSSVSQATGSVNIDECEP